MRFPWTFTLLVFCLLALTAPCQSSTIKTTDEPRFTVSAGPDGTVSAGPNGTARTEPDGTVSAGPDGTVSAGPDGTVSAGPDGTVSAGPDGTVSAGPDGTVSPRPEGTASAGPEATSSAGTFSPGPEGTTSARPDGTVSPRPEANSSAGTFSPGPEGTTSARPDGTTGAPTETPRSTTDIDSSNPTRETTDGRTATDGSTNATAPPTLQPAVRYTVSTPYGNAVGETYTVRVFPAGYSSFSSTKRISRFLGLPYAQPPTGERRFKSPVKAPAGNNLFNATELKPDCPQNGQASPTEDCLYYNIWTVQTAENANASVAYPVLIWIHGGRFETGGSYDSLRQGEELVTHQDAVVVTFNYRLGALGFLTLGNTNYSGNYGIQDQKLAIQVIHEVLPLFGGNRSQVALMGLDAGAASIGFHMMSSDTSALFSRVIMMGGSPMMPWSLTDDLQYVQGLNLLFIVGMNCTAGDEAVLSRCLQSVPVDKLIALQARFTRFFQGLEFFPVIDGKTISEDPWHAFSTGKFTSKDLLIGATNDEGANIAEDGLESLGIPVHGVNDSMLISLIEDSVRFYPRASRTLSPPGRQFLRLHFTGYTGANKGKDNFNTLGKAIGDWYLTCPVIQMARFAEAKNPNVYLYYFTEKEAFQDKWDGASHGEDESYVFGVPTLSGGIAYPPEKKRLSERMMEHVVQFAREGRPAQADLWKPLNYSIGKEMNYINYNADARIIGNYGSGYRLAECHFWNRTLAYVNGLVLPGVTTPAATTTTAVTTTTARTTTRNPIGPQDGGGCSAWAVNSATATTLGVLLSTQVLCAGALAFVIYKWKTLAKVAAESVPMS